MLGSTSRLRMRKREQPAHQAAATKSRLRTCMVVERATTAKRSHKSRPRVSTRSVRELPSRPTTASATSTTGMESRVVMANNTASSTRPPKKPPSTPIVMPISADTIVTVTPISMEMRQPQIRRER